MVKWHIGIMTLTYFFLYGFFLLDNDMYTGTAQEFIRIQVLLETYNTYNKEMKRS